MRLARLFPTLTLVAALSASACGGGAPPPPVAAPEPAAAPAVQPAPAPAANPTESKPEEDAWVGEKPKSSESKGDKSTPTPSSGGTETRNLDVIRKLVLDNRKAARKCYEDARRDLKDLKGDVVIHFVLDPEGKVKSAELNPRSTLKAPAVVDCVIGVIKGIPFPKSSLGMETSANYPFNFTP